MKIKKGDNVLIVAGKDRGKTGKILRSMPATSRVVVEGLNLVKKHMRPKREGEKGQMASVSASMDISNVKMICPNCKKATRVGYMIEGETKKRICKKCKQAI
jgi:large subunit ribosomal protein L24